MSKKMETLVEKYGKSVSTDVYFDGNFTVAVMTHRAKKLLVVGCAKRNPSSDPYVKERGIEIATARALVNLDRAFHPRKYKRAENAKIKKVSKNE